jgi:hypothetical protein
MVRMQDVDYLKGGLGPSISLGLSCLCAWWHSHSAFIQPGFGGVVIVSSSLRRE